MPASSRRWLFRALTTAVVAAAFCGAQRAGAAATITIVNGDGPGEGFNDATPAAPVGGNAGTTLGQQRLIAAQYAADFWGALLDSPVEVRVGFTFDPLLCSATGAVLGSTGPTSVSRDFAGALRPATWYPSALANKLFGADLDAGGDDIIGTFNSTIGTSCPLPRSFYYGLDASPPGNDIDFVTIVLHELAHGLGFVSLVDLSSGARFAGYDDTYSIALENHSSCKLYPNMTDAQRAAAAIDTGDLHWVASNVVGASHVLTGGLHPSGHVEMYAPDPALPGSSVSHFSTAATPNELLEPSYMGASHDVGLALELLLDAGWSGSPSTLTGGGCTGGEFLVNTTGAGSQEAPAVAADASGGFVVVWESSGINNTFLPDVPGQDGSSGGVFGRRYDSAGVALGPEFQINTYTLSGQSLPDVDGADDGSFIAIWSSNGQDGHGTGVFGQRFDSTGAPAGSEFQINTYTVGSQSSEPKIAADGDGNFVVTWSSLGQDGDLTGVFAQRFDSGGAPAGTEFQVNTFTFNRQGDNGLAAAMADDGTFVIVWKSSQQDSSEIGLYVDGGVFGQRFASDGAPVGTEFQVNTYTPGDQGTVALDIAMDADGDFIAVWRGVNDGDPYPNVVPYGGVLGQRFDSTGARAGTEFIVPTQRKGLQHDPRVSAADGGSFVVVWADQPRWPPAETPPLQRILSPIDVMAQRYDNTGAATGPQFRVNTYLSQSQRYPDVGLTPDGDFIVVWTSETCEGGATERLCLISQDGMSAGIVGQRYVISPPTCGPVPRASCYGSDRSTVSFVSGIFNWTWRKGAPLNSGHFGNPAAGITHYALCVYQDGAPLNPVIAAAVPPGGVCDNGQPCWKATGGKGYRYKDSGGVAGGVTKIQLKSGEEGHSRITVKGSAFSPPGLSLPLSPYTTLTVQLVNGNEECFEAVYTAPAVRNSGAGFKDKF